MPNPAFVLLLLVPDRGKLTPSNACKALAQCLAPIHFSSRRPFQDTEGRR